MQSWLNFWIIIFWLVFISFLLNPNNFISLLIFSEIVWLTLYCYSILVGSLIDDVNSFTLSFLILGLASVEFCLGFLLIILFKTLNKSINFGFTDNTWYTYFYKNNKKLSSYTNFWNLK